MTKAPAITESQFTCPFCGVFAEQMWFQVTGHPGRWKPNLAYPPPNPHSNSRREPLEANEFALEDIEQFDRGRAYRQMVDPKSRFLPATGETVVLNGFYSSLCMNAECRRSSLWHKETMLYPSTGGIETPNADLSPSIQEDYREAAAVLSRSPRAAAALLRLCVQNICKQLGLPGKKIDDDIAELVKRGLDPNIQKALDTLRVVGNAAVHPLTMDISDDRETASALFGLVNYIADRMISHPAMLERLYESLPQNARDAIARRDSSK